jgi:predicted peptidase
MYTLKKHARLVITVFAVCILILGGYIDFLDTTTLASQAPTTEKILSTLSQGGLSTNQFTDSSNNTMIYYLYVPANYSPQKKYPLVLLMPGGGERFDPSLTLQQNRDIQLNATYARVWSANYSAKNNPEVQQKYPSFVVVPQIRKDQQWVNVPSHQGSYTQALQPTISLLDVKVLLGLLQSTYTGIDANRLYITGISLGSYGIWDAIERWPNYFAAAAPIAGAGDPSKVADITQLPIWDFHGALDTVVPVSGSRDMINALRKAGGHPRYTEYPNMGHGSWGNAYSLDDATQPATGFYAWLFSQRKS